MNRIATERKRLDLTQEELAEKLNISQKSISKYETGARKPSFETLTEMAKLFNVSTDYLLGISDSRTGNSGLFADTPFPRRTIGSAIRLWIGKTGFGDDEIAEMLGISEELLKSYYSGESMPLETLVKLSEICEVSTDCLLGLREKTRPKQDGAYPFRFDPEISRRLKDQMQRMGESYSQIAAAIGIEEEEMFDFLEYGFVPHISVFAQIVEHFLVSSDFLLNRTGSTITIQEDEEELLLSYRALNSKSKTMALSRIYELEREEESLVAAKNRYLDREGKSLPSSGTGGGTMVG
ncbi:helix-turn-helix transcriptional regulator [Otoolea muris]|uniref:helix-turn-helix transcriptional regulator n=1 Tax=Otoolea muris TaxID=2941515 RepID=UPI0013633637|nr:helix-turn-helix transcriptional regulator [Otoolea muris]NBH17502.1 transcriptional regulator [Clostridiaceae bacterium]